VQLNLYLYLYILCATKTELYVTKTIGVMFFGRADQFRRRVLLIAITDDVIRGVEQLASLWCNTGLL
jgi:hypothetical protein